MASVPFTWCVRCLGSHRKTEVEQPMPSGMRVGCGRLGLLDGVHEIQRDGRLGQNRRCARGLGRLHVAEQLASQSMKVMVMGCRWCGRRESFA